MMIIEVLKLLSCACESGFLETWLSTSIACSLKSVTSFRFPYTIIFISSDKKLIALWPFVLDKWSQCCPAQRSGNIDLIKVTCLILWRFRMHFFYRYIILFYFGRSCLDWLIAVTREVMFSAPHSFSQVVLIKFLLINVASTFFILGT